MIEVLAQNFVKKMYPIKNRTAPSSYNDFRFEYCTIVLKNMNLCSIPPTLAALREHALRVYFQCQNWLGHELNPLDWGWMKDTTTMSLEPKFTSQKSIPDNLLKKFRCTCKTGCLKRCNCRKMGLKCSIFCKACKGSGCTNSEIDKDISASNEDDSDDEAKSENEGEECSPLKDIGDHVDSSMSESDTSEVGEDCALPTKRRRIE